MWRGCPSHRTHPGHSQAAKQRLTSKAKTVAEVCATFLCRLAPLLTLTAWLQPTYKVKMPAGGWKKLKAPQLRAACEERKIAVKPKEKPAAMVKKLAAFKG